MPTTRTRLTPGPLAWCLLAAVLGGCGGSTSTAPDPASLVPVQGRVTIGGRPFPTGMIAFNPADGEGNTPGAAGSIEGGGYTLRTDGSPGVLPGRYRVTINVDDTKELKEPLASIYTTVDTTPLVVEVREGAPASAYDLRLDPMRSQGASGKAGRRP